MADTTPEIRKYIMKITLIIRLALRRFVSNKAKYTSISVRPEIRDRIRRLKRGQESYSELLAKMADMYDPAEGTPREDTINEGHQSL